jgi:hypothetical protein
MSDHNREGRPVLSLEAAALTAPGGLTHLEDVRTVPRVKGIYAWWFAPDALVVPDAPYVRAAERELLYVGIAPKKPSAAGRPSSSTLHTRLATHARNNASRSTLRLSLGVLLADTLELTLRLQRGRPTWGIDGELRLTNWMHEHARISWVALDTPWIVEDEMLSSVPLALNIDGRDDAFASSLSLRRSAARATARRATINVEEA